jgi:hypothetical protein
MHYSTKLNRANGYLHLTDMPAELKSSDALQYMSCPRWSGIIFYLIFSPSVKMLTIERPQNPDHFEMKVG